MCPFDLSSGSKVGSVKDSYIALVLMAPVTRHRDSLPRQSSGDREDFDEVPGDDNFENTSVEAVIVNNFDNEQHLDERINEILGIVSNHFFTW